MRAMTDHSTAQQVFDELAAEHLHQPGVGRRMMFGRDTLTVDGRMFAFRHHDQLALKLPPATAAAMLAAGQGVVPHMGNRAMRNWIAVPLPDTPADHHRWAQLLTQARTHIRGESTTPSRTSHGDPDRPAPQHEQRFARLVAEFAVSPDVTGPDPSSRGFGSSALTVNGSIFAMLTADTLVVKLPPDRVNALISEGTGDPYDAGKRRPMKEWLKVTTINDHDTWLALAHEAHHFVRSRPR